MRILTLKYDKEILNAIQDKCVVVYTDSLDSIILKYAEAKRNKDVLAMVVSLPYTSISQIDFKPEWAEIPMVINVYNIGDYYSFFSKINSIKHLNVRIYLSSKSHSVYTDLKVMASVGIDCGIILENGIKLDDEKLLDLASYYFMSPVCHATIEPFEFILRHLSSEKNEGFDNVYFDNPLSFKYIKKIDDLEEADSDELAFERKMQCYYKHFMDLDECSKCPAFKICDHKMISKLESCSKTMNEIFEFAEIRNNMNNNQTKTKTICQL